MLKTIAALLKDVLNLLIMALRWLPIVPTLQIIDWLHGFIY